MHEFEAIEMAVLDALGPLTRTGGLKTLEAYAGQVEADDADALARVVQRFPCCYVLANPIELDRRSRFDDVAVTVALVIGDRNLRGVSEARTGDPQSPGVYALLEAARALLHRKNPVSGWGMFFCEREEALFLAPKRGICFYAAQYATARAQ